MLRKITLVALILLSVTSFYSCASGPIAGPISARHVQEMKLAKKVYISVSARQAGSGKELPIST